jgi:hypothetical protein
MRDVMRLTTPLETLTRRACLQRAGLSALTLLSPSVLPSARAGTPSSRQASASGRQTFAACWDDARGQHHVGWLRLSESGQVSVTGAQQLPTRGHGLALLPDGTLVVAARRPGDWLLRLSPGKKPQWLWQEPGRAFSGHAHVSADKRTIFTTEVDTDSGQGLLGVREAATLEKRAEFITNGLDPHVVSALPAIAKIVIGGHTRPNPPLAEMLFVANGGIDTAVETGRIKRDLPRMDSSIVCLHPETGERLGQWRLPDPRLSLRHLAWSGTDATPAGAPGLPRLGVALQAEHDEAWQRAAAPLLAVLRWDEQADGMLSAAHGQPALAGYGGDVAVLGRGAAAQFVVSATRGDALAHYDMSGRFLGSTTLPQAGALAAAESKLWAGGSIGLGQVQLPGQAEAGCALAPWRSGRIDNHLLRI